LRAGRTGGWEQQPAGGGAGMVQKSEGREDAGALLAAPVEGGEGSGPRPAGHSRSADTSDQPGGVHIKGRQDGSAVRGMLAAEWVPDVPGSVSVGASRDRGVGRRRPSCRIWWQPRGHPCGRKRRIHSWVGRVMVFHRWVREFAERQQTLPSSMERIRELVKACDGHIGLSNRALFQCLAQAVCNR
jgi:hypothetical protein